MIWRQTASNDGGVSSGDLVLSLYFLLFPVKFTADW